MELNAQGSMMKSNEPGEASRERPEHVGSPPRLRMREGDRLVDAPRSDQDLAGDYPQWPDKGPLVGGLRITIMAAKRRYVVAEPARILHVLEAVQPGHDVYVMGPKPVYGEHVNDRLVTPPALDNDEPWIPGFYDGAVLPSPAVDYNYEITTYRFSRPGVYRVRWKLGRLISNVLTLEVVDES